MAKRQGNRPPQSSQFQDLDEGVAVLAEHYPRTFFVNARLRRPLKVGIDQDSKADIAKSPNSELKDYDIDALLDHYTGHAGYQQACAVAGAERIDLNGNPVGKSRQLKRERQA